MNGKTNWWYSADGKRGFCVASVKGYDYRPQSEGRMTTTLFLYLDSGIFHLSGAEAEAVFKLVKDKVKS